MTKKTKAKWRISDILEAMGESGAVIRGAVIHDLRAHEGTVRDILGRRWNATIPSIFGLPPAHSDEAVERVAQRLVAEARRLNVPRRG